MVGIELGLRLVLGNAGGVRQGVSRWTLLLSCCDVTDESIEAGERRNVFKWGAVCS